jgi:hypothetical protein
MLIKQLIILDEHGQSSSPSRERAISRLTSGLSQSSSGSGRCAQAPGRRCTPFVAETDSVDGDSSSGYRMISVLRWRSSSGTGIESGVSW